MSYWSRYWSRFWELPTAPTQAVSESSEKDVPLEQLPPTVARQIMQQSSRPNTIKGQAAQILQRSMGNQGLIKPSQGGRPLPDSLRSRLEASLDADLSSVRLHHDEEKTQALNAQALTVGEHIFLNRLADMNNLGLLSHEVVHVVQVRQRGTQPGMSQKDSASEREAEEMGRAIATGESVSLTTTGGPLPEIQRKEAAAGMPAPANPLILRESVRAVLLLHYQKQGGEGPFTLTPALKSELQRLIPNLSGDDLMLLWTPEPSGPLEALHRLSEAGYLPLVAAEPKPAPEAEPS